MKVPFETKVTEEIINQGTFTNGSHTILTGQENDSDGFTLVGRRNYATDTTDYINQYVLWSYRLELTNYTEISFLAKKNANHGNIAVCVVNSLSDTYDANLASKWINYANAPTSWTQYSLDVSTITGEKYIVFIGGYSDNSGNTTSSTSFCDIRFVGVKEIPRKFQEGVVGSTNVIEGMVIPVGYEQLVNYTMLYDSGDECEDVSGGWVGGAYITVSGYGTGTYTKYDTYMYCKAGGTSSLVSCGFFTNNLIDLSEINKIFYNFTQYSMGYNATIAVNPTQRKGGGNTGVVAEKTNSQGLGVGLQELDVSAVAQSCYVGFGCWAYGSIVAVDTVFATKPDDFATLAEKAGITASSIDDILTASETLLANKDAVNFMIAQCTGDFMASAVTSETFMTALESSPYKTLVQSNEHWAKFLAMVA